MLITRISELTGIQRTQEIEVTEEQLTAWRNGGLIQKVMPNLTDSEREFIMNGITQEEWDTEYPEKDDSDQD